MLRALIVSIMLLIGASAWAQDRGPSMFPPVPTQTTPQQPPAAPPVVVNNPSSDNSILGWLFGGLGTLATAIFGKMAFFPQKGSSGSTSAPDLSKLEPIIEALLTKVIQSGALAPVITQLLGPFGPLEPVLRKIVLGILQQHGVQSAGQLVGTGVAPAAPMTIPGSLFPSANPPMFQNLNIDLEALASQIAERLGRPAAPPPPAG